MPESAAVPDEEGLYEHILVPTDGSEGARRGIRHGLDLARQYHAKVHVLHVIDERTQVETPAFSSEELVLDKLEEQAEELLDEVESEAARLDLDVTCKCVRGVPQEEIRRYASGNGVDLIVMGLHGGRRGAHPHVGSTTDRVLRQSEVPVLPV